MPPQLPETTNGIIDTDWTHQSGSEDYGAHRVVNGGTVIGQVLTVPPGYNHSNFSGRAGQQGWKWTGTEFPSSFTLEPRNTGFTNAISDEPTWYDDNDVTSITLPPTSPETGASIWKIERADNNALVGYLVKASKGLRWVLKDSELTGHKLPNTALNFTSASWPGSWSGSWSNAFNPQRS